MCFLLFTSAGGPHPQKRTRHSHKTEAHQLFSLVRSVSLSLSVSVCVCVRPFLCVLPLLFCGTVPVAMLSFLCKFLMPPAKWFYCIWWKLFTPTNFEHQQRGMQKVKDPQDSYIQWCSSKDHKDECIHEIDLYIFRRFLVQFDAIHQSTNHAILYMVYEYEYECLCMYECMCECVCGGGGVSNCKYLHGMARRLQNLIGQSVVMTNWANISPLAICVRPSPFVVGHLRINNIDCIFLYAMQFAAEQTECATSNKQISQTNVNGGQQCGMRHAARALANASWWEATLIKYSTAFWGKLLATAVACGNPPSLTLRIKGKCSWKFFSSSELLNVIWDSPLIVCQTRVSSHP